MSIFRSAQSFYGKLRQLSSFGQTPTEEATQVPDTEPRVSELKDAGASQDALREPGEGDPSGDFGDFQAGLGAKQVEPSENTALALKDATIAALERQLVDLRGLGDELARTEQARLAGLDRIAELEAQSSAAPTESAADCGAPTDLLDLMDELQAKVERLNRQLARREAVCKRTAERLEKMRVKHAERHTTAADRWREISKLKGEKRQLASQLKQARAGQGQREE